MKKNHFFRREVTNTALSELALLKRWLILIFFLTVLTAVTVMVMSLSLSSIQSLGETASAHNF